MTRAEKCVVRNCLHLGAELIPFEHACCRFFGRGTHALIYPPCLGGFPPWQQGGSPGPLDSESGVCRDDESVHPTGDTAMMAVKPDTPRFGVHVT